MSADRYFGAVDVSDWCARHAVFNSTRLCTGRFVHGSENLVLDASAEEHIGVTWRIRLNDPCVTAMRP